LLEIDREDAYSYAKFSDALVRDAQKLRESPLLTDLIVCLAYVSLAGECRISGLI
jgi:hypothetical protein